ncbi:MAG: hypothetical protein ACFFGZ_11455 [Candidatus Thorarchaeota archaeon]
MISKKPTLFGLLFIIFLIFSFSSNLHPVNGERPNQNIASANPDHSSPSLTTNTTTFDFEFNAGTGYADQYISPLTFHENAAISVNASWTEGSEYDIIDLGLYIGDPGMENPGYGGDEITGWALASAGGSPEYYQGTAPVTSSQYYLRIINFPNVATSGRIEVIEEYVAIPWDFSHTTHFNVSLVFVGYDASLLDESSFLSYLPQHNFAYTGSAPGATIFHTYDYQVHHANESYVQAVEEYVLANSINGTGTTAKLDIAALEYQREHLSRQEIFLPQDGRAINATAMDEYLAQNPIDRQADFAIYLLNFSQYDTPDHSLEHWFNVSEPTTETGVNRHWWRLEWDNPQNFDAAFPYAGFGTAYRHFFLDPYAFQWYLTWAVIWRGVRTGDGLHDFYTQDLDEYQKTHDIRSAGGQQAIMRYLGSWVAELMPQFLSWSAIGPISPPQSIALEVLLLQNVTHLGFSNEDLAWTVNEPFIQSIYGHLLPDADLSLDITIMDLADWPEFEAILLNSQYAHPTPPQSQWRYYDGYGVFYATEARRGQDFDLSKADIVVTAYMFILDNASFASESTPWAGKEYTGLGGGGHVTMLMELDRLYYPDRITPRQGLTDILVHEIGHAIGFPHTFSANELAGDFLGDVMGYYPGTGNFSAIRIEGYQRYQADGALQHRKTLLLDAARGYRSIPGVRRFLGAAETIFRDFQQLYRQHDYGLALQKAAELDPILYEIQTIVNSGDNQLPTIDSPADVSYEEGTTGHVLTWNPVDANPKNYTIYRDGMNIASGDWSGEAVSIEIDGLAFGTYNFTIVVMDIAYGAVQDTVWVEVNESEGSPGFAPMAALVILGTIGVIRRMQRSAR